MKNSTTKSHRFSAQLFSIFLLILLIFPVVPAARNSGKNNNIQLKTEKESSQTKEAKESHASDDLAPSAVFTNPASISIPDNGSATPSTINVTGLGGTVTKVTVKLNNITVVGCGTCSGTQDLDFLLVSPDNKKFNFMSDTGNGSNAGVSGVNLTLDDAAGSQLPTIDDSGAQLSSGTFRPTDRNSFGAGDGNDTFPGAPAGTQFSPATEGSSTFASVFNGISPNGNWRLFAIDDAAHSSSPASSVGGGWEIDITVSAVAVATTTTVSSNNNPSFTTAPNNAVTFTANVTSTSTVNEGTVSFTANAAAISGCTNVAVSAGSAVCNTSFATEGVRAITAFYNGTANFNTSNGSLSPPQEVNKHTTVNAGNEYCNTGPIMLDDSAGFNSTPYPSKIFVSGLGGTISKVTLKLNNMTLFDTRETDILLVGPGGQKFMVLADVGDSANTTGVNLVLDDAAATSLPNSGGLSSGTFRPTDYISTLEPGGDVLAPPAPAPPYNQPAPTGSATFANVFNGISPNGTWQLFVEDESQLGGADGFIAGGWCLTFTTTNDPPTTTTLTSTPNPAFINQGIAFTATVTSGATPVTTGTVNFREGATVLASNVALNGAGQAVYNSPAGTLPEGSHLIEADYSGVPGSFNTSTGSTNQVVNNVTTTVGASFCNTGTITAFDLVDSTTPYPSNIFVTGLAGTFQKVTVTLNNMTIQPESRDLDILLVGPNGEKFVILSDVGGTGGTTGATITLDDAGGAALPLTGGLTSGTFKPTDGTSGFEPGGETFMPPAPAPPYNRAAPEGAATFASVFPVGTSPNGTWSLYVMDDAASGGNNPTIAGGWCVTPTLAPISTTTAQVTSNNNPAQTAENVTFTTTVTATTGTPTGTVEFFADATSLGTATLTPVPAPPPASDQLAPNASAQAQLTTMFEFGGNYNITAVYSGALQPGGGGFAPSNSNAAPLAQVIIGPTAAAVSLGGRVSSGATGRAISKARVTLVDGNGTIRYAMTNPFGYYRFTDVAVGETYTLNVSAKNRVFGTATRVISVNEELTNVNFFSDN